MRENNGCFGGESCLETLLYLEDLAEKKIKIYSRLLTDMDLAQDMEKISARHAERKSVLQKLLYGKADKKKAENTRGMSATNGEETQE